MPKKTYPIWTMHSQHRCGAASLRYRNQAAIMSEQKPCPVCFSCPRKSCDPHDSVSVDLYVDIIESVGTTDLEAFFSHW